MLASRQVEKQQQKSIYTSKEGEKWERVSEGEREREKKERRNKMTEKLKYNIILRFFALLRRRRICVFCIIENIYSI